MPVDAPLRGIVRAAWSEAVADGADHTECLSRTVRAVLAAAPEMSAPEMSAPDALAYVRYARPDDAERNQKGPAPKDRP